MKTIPKRELRNHSGEVLRQAESGERFTITVEGRQAPDPTFFEDVKELGGTLDDLGDPWER